MDSNTENTEQWVFRPHEIGRVCKKCNILFPSWKHLMMHKEKMRAAGKSHNHCKFCGQDFVTRGAEIMHIQQYHAEKQALECPGCGQGPFPRVGSLMWHIENECVRLDIATLEEVREKKLEFPKKLEALTGEPVKGNYSSFMPKSNTGGSVRGAPAAFGSLFNEEDQFLGLDELKPTTGYHTHEKWGSVSEWSPGNSKASELTSLSMATVKEPDLSDTHSRMQYHHHPDNPGFSIARYHCECSGRYNCPLCHKCFKKAGGLIGHLRSPAHGDKNYCCPGCHRIFKSLTAITQHCESSGKRCQFRNTDSYDAFLDQLTGGMISIDLGRNDDGTLNYHTSKDAKEVFGGKRLTGDKAVVAVRPFEYQKTCAWDTPVPEIKW